MKSYITIIILLMIGEHCAHAATVLEKAQTEAAQRTQLTAMNSAQRKALQGASAREAEKERLKAELAKLEEQNKLNAATRNATDRAATNSDQYAKDLFELQKYAYENFVQDKPLSSVLENKITSFQQQYPHPTDNQTITQSLERLYALQLANHVKSIFTAAFEAKDAKTAWDEAFFEAAQTALSIDRRANTAVGTPAYQYMMGYGIQFLNAIKTKALDYARAYYPTIEGFKSFDTIGGRFKIVQNLDLDNRRSIFEARDALNQYKTKNLKSLLDQLKEQQLALSQANVFNASSSQRTHPLSSEQKLKEEIAELEAALAASTVTKAVPSTRFSADKGAFTRLHKPLPPLQTEEQINKDVASRKQQIIQDALLYVQTYPELLAKNEFYADQAKDQKNLERRKQLEQKNVTLLNSLDTLQPEYSRASKMDANNAMVLQITAILQNGVANSIKQRNLAEETANGLEDQKLLTTFERIIENIKRIEDALQTGIQKDEEDSSIQKPLTNEARVRFQKALSALKKEHAILQSFLDEEDIKRRGEKIIQHGKDILTSFDALNAKLARAKTPDARKEIEQEIHTLSLIAPDLLVAAQYRRDAAKRAFPPTAIRAYILAKKDEIKRNPEYQKQWNAKKK